MRASSPAVCVVLAVLCLSPVVSSARSDRPRVVTKRPSYPQRVLVNDGSPVHNVGELQIHVANWGMFGSLPGSGAPFAESPSAQWPAGSGVEYLFDAGLWVGAIKNGVPSVSTANAYQFEFRPSPDPRDIIYRSAEGARGGNRLPSPDADDDGDGAVDEDWLNGYDDDGDGAIDEDFAAVSKQMFSCQYVDNDPAAMRIYPEHNPLNLHVRQESYQWEDDRFDDFVGINYWITNIGNDVLEDVYIGFFADCDAGSRDRENYYDDDMTGLLRVPIDCPDLGPVSFDVAYTYDADGDDGETLGYFGVMFLGHTTDPTGQTAPTRVGITTYSSFAGQVAYEDGGDPTTDFERYDLLSSGRLKRNSTVPRDYRMLVAAGPFETLLPGSTLVFQTAFVIGKGLRGPGSLSENAASAQLTYNGAWFDVDHDRSTGIAGRETPVPGPIQGVVIDSCVSPVPINWGSRDPIWINDDCAAEQRAILACGYTLTDSLTFMTGVDGKETQINWIVGTAPPPPAMRVDPAYDGGVALYWDNFSEVTPDVKTLEHDFEGYRVWRADNWKRPSGTSVRTGPPHDLWKLLLEADVVNNLGADTGLDALRYQPLVPHILSAGRRTEFVNALVAFMTEYPGEDPPCPQGVTPEVCDTLTALAAAVLGRPEGRRYYRYIDTIVHPGRPYFYAVTASDHDIVGTGAARTFAEGKTGDPSSNFVYVEPSTRSQPRYAYREEEVYVVPNPATTESMEPWALGPNNDDPTGIKVEFRNLPASRGTIRIYTLAGDLVEDMPFDGSGGVGTMRWDLVSRNGQDVASGVYLFSVEADGYPRRIGKFVVIR